MINVIPEKKYKDKISDSYKIHPKGIEENIKKEKIKNKITTSLIGVIILVFFIGYVGRTSYVRFLSENPYYEGKKIKISQIQKQLPVLEDELGIREVNYNWAGSLEYNNKPSIIVFHHAASNGLTPEKINEMHIAKEWSGIGYHFYIRKDGTIYRGRPEEAIGAHIKGQNKNTIGICLEGNLEESKPTEEEISSLEKLSTYLIIKYNIVKVQGHGDTYKTLCPGSNFPMESVKKEITCEIEELSKEDN